MLRPRNAGSNTAAHHQSVIRAPLDQAGIGTRPSREILVRIDGAGSTHHTLAELARRRVSYSVRFTLPLDTPEPYQKIPETAWTPTYTSNGKIRHRRRARCKKPRHRLLAIPATLPARAAASSCTSRTPTDRPISPWLQSACCAAYLPTPRKTPSARTARTPQRHAANPRTRLTQPSQLDDTAAEPPPRTHPLKSNLNSPIASTRQPGIRPISPKPCANQP